MFLVNHSIIPLFEKTHNATTTQEKGQVVTWADKSMVHFDTHPQRDSPFSSLSTTCSPGFNPTAGPTQVAQTMQISLIDAVDIMGVGRTSIIRRSGATFTVGENKSTQKKITVEIKGTPSQVHTAQRLIQAKTGPGRVSFKRVRVVADQVAQTMQIPLNDAVGIIRVEGTSFGCKSGAIFKIQDSKVSRKRILVEIRGTKSQVQTAQQLIQAKTGPSRVSFGKVTPIVDQPLTGPGLDGRWSSGTSPPLAASKEPVEPMVEVPPELPKVQPASELMAIETKAKVQTELPQLQPSNDQLHINKDLPPNSDLCNPHHHLSPPPHITAAPSGMESMGEPKRIRMIWHINIVKTFLKACIHEITINGSLISMSWEKVGETLKASHNFSADEKQMKNYFNGLKSKYEAWVSLKNKSGNKYDPSTNMFNLTYKEWETEIKKNKCIETLRKAPLRFPDLCAQLFDNDLSTGSFQTSVDHALTGSEPAHRPNGEASLEPQAAVPLVPSSASTETPVESQKEPMVQVPTATAFVTVETKAEVLRESPEVQLVAIETEAEVPPELPEVQPASAHEAIETKPDEPVVPVSTDDSNMVDEPMEMEVDKSVVRTRPDRVFSRPVRDFFGKRLTLYGPGQTSPGPDWESVKEPKRIRVSWENINVVKIFLDACLHEVKFNGREDGSLKAMSWKKVGEILKDSHNFCVDSKQMKNYFDGLKSKYRAWVSLKNKTGSKYDPSTNMFNLTDKEWETEIKKNKCIETLRNAPLPFPDLCAQLFDGVISTGFSQTGVDQALTEPEQGEITNEPQAVVPLVPPSSEKSPPLVTTEALVEPQKEAIICSSLVEVPPEVPKVQPASEVVAIETKRSMSVFEEEILGVLKMIADKINKPEPPPKPTFEDCEKKLSELGWPKDDPLHLVALTIFCDKNDNYRELWMKLNPNLCADWVRMIGRSKRFT